LGCGVWLRATETISAALWATGPPEGLYRLLDVIIIQLSKHWHLRSDVNGSDVASVKSMLAVEDGMSLSTGWRQEGHPASKLCCKIICALASLHRMNDWQT